MTKRVVTKEERQKAYVKVFGAAVEANSKYGTREKGKPYAAQVRTGKTKKDKSQG